MTGIKTETTHLAKSAFSAEAPPRPLVGCVTPEGKLTQVQPIGADPRKFDENATEVYGVGAFLLAGSEVYQLNH